MTNRTTSLLLLFVSGLGVTGLLLAALIAALGSSATSPWMAPVVASLCATWVLYVGRRYILPPSLLTSPTRALAILAAIVSTALAVSMGTVWLLEWSVGRVMHVPSLIVPLWYAILWVLVQRQHPQHRSVA